MLSTVLIAYFYGLLLCFSGIDVNARDFAGWTPLHEAASHGHVECVHELLNFLPNRTVYHKGNTDPLYLGQALVNSREVSFSYPDIFYLNNQP